MEAWVALNTIIVVGMLLRNEYDEKQLCENLVKIQSSEVKRLDDGIQSRTATVLY